MTNRGKGWRFAAVLTGLGSGLAAEQTASAGPWPLARKEKLSITTLVAAPAALRGPTQSDDPLDFGSESADAAVIETYAEWGLGAGFTAIGKAQTAWQGPATGQTTGSYEFGLRRTIARRGDFVFAWQASLAGGPSQNEACAGERAELRLLAGWGRKFGRRNAFAALESGGRVRTDACAGVKTDFALGVELVPNRLQFLSQSFFDLDRERRNSRNLTLKFQQSLVLRVSPKWSAQIGGRFGVTEQSRERSALVALWRRF